VGVRGVRGGGITARRMDWHIQYIGRGFKNVVGNG